MLPSRIADLIETTRDRLPGQWEEWAAAAAQQALEAKSFATCVLEFEDLLVDGYWTFDGPADRAEFVAPLVAALKIAYGEASATTLAAA